jgi:hypothetical protein
MVGQSVAAAPIGGYSAPELACSRQGSYAS